MLLSLGSRCAVHMANTLYNMQRITVRASYGLKLAEGTYFILYIYFVYSVVLYLHEVTHEESTVDIVQAPKSAPCTVNVGCRYDAHDANPLT